MTAAPRPMPAFADVDMEFEERSSVVVGVVLFVLVLMSVVGGVVVRGERVMSGS